MPSASEVQIALCIERITNLTISQEKLCNLLEATIQADHQRHEETEERVKQLEDFNLMWRSRLDGGKFTVRIAAVSAFVIIMFAVKGFWGGIMSAIDAMKNG
jgi:hypothetical protein